MQFKRIRSVYPRFHNDVARSLCHVRYVLSFGYNSSAFGELTSHGYAYIGQIDWCKVYKNGSIIMQEKMIKNHLCMLDRVLVVGKIEDEAFEFLQ